MRKGIIILCLFFVACNATIYEESSSIISIERSNTKEYKYIYTLYRQDMIGKLEVYSNKEYKINDVITFIPREKAKEIK